MRFAPVSAPPIPPPPLPGCPPVWVHAPGSGSVAGWQFWDIPQGRAWANLADLVAWVTQSASGAASSHQHFGE